MNFEASCEHAGAIEVWGLVDHFSILSEEGAGANRKFWLDCGCASPVRAALFKPRRTHKAELEPQAEFAAYKVALLLGLPSAVIDLVTFNDEQGCLSWQIVPWGDEHIHGTSLLPPHGIDVDRDRAGHSTENIARALSGVKPPLKFTAEPKLTSMDVFVGYLILDTLIGNRDRHSENWAVSRNVNDGTVTLLPSFDHASSFGISEREEGAQRRVESPAFFEKYRSKSFADRFEDGKKVRLVDYTCKALKYSASEAGQAHWVDVLRSLEVEGLKKALGESHFTPHALEFARRLVVANLEELKSCLM